MFISGSSYLAIVIAIEFVRSRGGLSVICGNKPPEAVIAPDRQPDMSGAIRFSPEGKSERTQQIAGSEDVDVMNERLRILRGEADDSPVVLRGLRKIYNSPPKVAVQSLFFEVPRGQCFGFLGVNGRLRICDILFLINSDLKRQNYDVENFGRRRIAHFRSCSSQRL